MAQLQLFVDLILNNRYQITRQLGRGGMGAVYEATDLLTSRQIAIKQLLPTDPELQRAFKREATILSQIKHPNLPQALDYFQNETGLFLVMEFIPGQNLGELLSSREGIPFASHQVKRWAEELLKLLIFLHGQALPIIHRDIKPANLKLTPQGHIALLDFGLAKELDQDNESTTNMCIFGYTPHYAPLEQIQGESTNTYSDIYALGASLYHLLTGIQPTDSLKRANDILCKKRDPLPHVSHVVQGIPQSLASLVMKALSLAPSDRPLSASQMLQQLQAGIIAPSFKRIQNTLTQPDVQEIPLEATNGYPDTFEATIVTSKNGHTPNRPLTLVPASNSPALKPNRISVTFPQHRLHLAPRWTTTQTIPTVPPEILQLRATNQHLHKTNTRILKYASAANILLVLLCAAIISTFLYQSALNPIPNSHSQSDSTADKEPNLRSSGAAPPNKRSNIRTPTQTPALFTEVEDHNQVPEITIEQFIRSQIIKSQNKANKKARRQNWQTSRHTTPLTSL